MKLKDVYIAPKESGLRQPIEWQNRQIIEKIGSPIRIRVNFRGIRPEDIKVYAITSNA